MFKKYLATKSLIIYRCFYGSFLIRVEFVANQIISVVEIYVEVQITLLSAVYCGCPKSHRHFNASTYYLGYQKKI